ncbi:MAG: type II CRISPR RNA-guided endonuclease Cas9 [Bacteroidales bacterium]|nr:type II CRISPR RNA-guided endonuclease Cas9 [Bacteroidales bacterium]
MKKVLGLDLGTNSIGWALIERDFENKSDNALGEGNIIGMGSRIIPMSQDILDKFGTGQTVSQTAERTGHRGVRRLRQRHLLRRERLHRVLNILNALPKYYSEKIDFQNRKGQFVNNTEVKLPYLKNETGEYEFLFSTSFNEMVSEFKQSQPDLFYTKENGKETRIPYDWTIYYLRKKALSKEITLQELAWIILNFNQKRGYYQLRGEEEEIDKTKLVEFHAFKVESVSAEEPNFKKEIWYNVNLENGWIYRRKSKTPLDDWIGKTKEFIVTTSLNDDGTVKTDKDGKEKRSFRAPKEDDWTLIKKKTECKLDTFNRENNCVGVGTYIYTTLLQNPKQKINGKLVKTIERHFYKEELIKILETQQKFHPVLQSNKLLESCINELYPNNYGQQSILKNKDFVYLFVNDIIFYQRPLKSKKSLIDGCRYESRSYRSKEGVYITEPIKVIAKSHPLFQEFRIWQFVENIRIYERESLVDTRRVSDVDVTAEFIPSVKEKLELFEYFNNRAKIKQSQFLSFYKDSFGKKLSEKDYRWNYVEEKEYPLNETRALFNTIFKKFADFDRNAFLTKENEERLWHLLYSISDKKELEKALDSENFKMEIPKEVRQEYKNVKPFNKEYGAFSAKAIKKLLPLMRLRDYSKDIDDECKKRIDDIYIRLETINHAKDKIVEVSDDDITKGMLKSFCGVEKKYQGLKLHQASYIVYGKHAESINTDVWNTPEKIDDFLREFKQHSVRNPIVEQVVTETFRVVKDIWMKYGNGEESFFDEIHIELGRDMKNPSEIRKSMTANINKNQDTNQRIRTLLKEFKNQNIEGVIPHSPNQQEKLRIFEEDILSSSKEMPDDIERISKIAEPTAKEIEKYRLWMEQMYRSPYTGNIIPLSKLFTTDYEIEHIIPQSRFFDNSNGNKVICEAGVNRFKDKQTAFEMINKNPGQVIELGQGLSAKLLTVEAYQDFVSQNFRKGSKKHKILLSEDIPEQFLSRQLNDTRYISKLVKELLSSIVRQEGEQEATSKNVVSVTGNVTSILKHDWGLNDKWNEIVAPRFERLNKLTNSNDFGYFDKENRFFRTTVPHELKKNFNKKRIDHRHHAMDALAIACATRSHVGLLSNEHAKSDNIRYDLSRKLRHQKDIQKNGRTIKVPKAFYLPWDNFPVDAKIALENIVVSFKQNLRVINKAINKYQVWEDEEGLLKKKVKKQIKGDNWAIRKPIHKETVSGKVNLRFKNEVNLSSAIDSGSIIVDKKLNQKIKSLRKRGYNNESLKKYFKDRKYIFNDKNVSKVEAYYFSSDNNDIRKHYSAARPINIIDKTFNSKKIQSVTDLSIQRILLKHLEKHNEVNDNGTFKERPDLSFSQEGLEDMNRNIKDLNGGRNHKAIYKARIYETLGNKFPVGISGNKKDKYVEAAKGTNLFFAIYKGENKNGEEVRQYDTIPLNIVIERQKQGGSSVPEHFYDKDENEYNLLFALSPNDLVYMPNEEDQDIVKSVDFRVDQKGRIYKMVSSSGKQCFFVRNDISTTIINKEEFGPLNKMEKDIFGQMIKDKCIKLKVDRLGQIVNVSEY